MRTGIDQTGLQILLQRADQFVQLCADLFQRSLNLDALGADVLGIGRQVKAAEQLLEGSRDGRCFAFERRQAVLCDLRNVRLQVSVECSGGLHKLADPFIGPSQTYLLLD